MRKLRVPFADFSVKDKPLMKVNFKAEYPSDIPHDHDYYDEVRVLENYFLGALRWRSRRSSNSGLSARNRSNGGNG